MKSAIATIAFLLFIWGCKNEKAKSPPPEDQRLEQVFADNNYQLTGVAVSKNGRLFTNYPLWSTVYKNAVVEISPGNHVKPYPDSISNSWKQGDTAVSKWICVQAVVIDAQDQLWVVDPASPYQKGVYARSQKLVCIDPETNTLKRVYSLSGVTDDQSYINDVRVDNFTKTAYLTNSKEGGLIVVDLISGKARQVLQGDGSVLADTSYHLVIDGKRLEKDGAPFRGNSDGIALNPDGSYLYYKSLTDNKLYRIKTAFLRDTTLPAGQLAAKVEPLGKFVATDGMTFDQKGNLYLGDLEHYRIVKLDTALKMSVLVEDGRLIWPDSYQVSADGYLYISCSQINRQAEYNKGVSTRTSPYGIYRIKLP